jgi:hypothetical protein
MNETQKSKTLSVEPIPNKPAAKAYGKSSLLGTTEVVPYKEGNSRRKPTG